METRNTAIWVTQLFLAAFPTGSVSVKLAILSQPHFPTSSACLELVSLHSNNNRIDARYLMSGPYIMMQRVWAGDVTANPEKELP